MSDIRGIDIGNGVLLAPHPFVSDDDEEINYRPVTPANYQIKLRAIREFCLDLEQRDSSKFISPTWVSGHIMCVLKYGDGFTQNDLPGRPRQKKHWWRR